MDDIIIGVAGSGTMGTGIAQVFIQCGFSVILHDIDEQIAAKSKEIISARINRLVEKERLTEAEAAAIQSRLATTTQLRDFHACDFVIEAAPENIDIKKTIFQQLEAYCQKETILATNTSSLSVTEIASFIESPSRVAGLHFFNPAPIMPLVEIVKGIETKEETVHALYQLAKAINKSPVICEDSPGFIVNRIARSYYNEAIKLMKEQTASIEQIDRILKQTGNFKMGPFELQDLIGIDINYAATNSIYKEFHEESRFRPHYYQKRLVQAGKLGRKTQGGYYRYE